MSAFLAVKAAVETGRPCRKVDYDEVVQRAQKARDYFANKPRVDDSFEIDVSSFVNRLKVIPGKGPPLLRLDQIDDLDLVIERVYRG